MEDLKIESGIPIPIAGHRCSGSALVVSKMNVGDSVLVKKNTVVGFFQAAKRRGMKMTSRTEGDKLRIWRIS